MERPSCRTLFTQAMVRAFSFARPKAGRSMLARMAMILITTNSSISVKALPGDFRCVILGLFTTGGRYGIHPSFASGNGKGKHPSPNLQLPTSNFEIHAGAVGQ